MICGITQSEEDSDSSSTTTNSESSSDTDDETIQDIPDKEFFKTLSCLKNKDPSIYDNNVEFFNNAGPVVVKKSQAITSKSGDSGTQNLPNSNVSHKPVKASNKFSLKDIDNDSSSEDEMAAFKKEIKHETEADNEVENEYIKFLKGGKSSIGDKEAESSLKPLYNYWNKQELDDNEKFLKDYILNKKYLTTETEVKADEVNLSEDEKELEEQEEYEVNYNLRFENDDNLKLKRFPRTIEGSLRRKNDARSKKRAEIAERKKNEKLKKHQDVKKKQKEKLSEIEERLQKLKEMTGNVELGFKDDEILEDFDPEKHDQKMKELYNEDYYNNADENEYPKFEDDENYWDNDDINMDCDAEIPNPKEKLTRTQKKKLRKKKTFQDIMDLAKPSFNPNVHNEFKKYLDDYYSLDCEDFIDDLPCKFKYREVVPNDYGLSVEEILMADDTELNRWASVKKITRRQLEHVEKNEVKIYRSKAQDEYLKRKLLPSLFVDPEEAKETNDDSPQDGEADKKDRQTSGDEGHPALKENGEAEQAGAGAVNETNESKKNKRKKRKRGNKNATIPTNNDVNAANQQDESSVPSKAEKLVQEIKDVTKPEKPETGDNTSSTNISKKKKRRKNKNKQVSNTNITSNSSSDQQKPITPKKEAQLQNARAGQGSGNQKHNKQQEANKMKKTKKNFAFKNKNKKGVVNLSDNRLLAYGIKPKQFRSKIIYSQKNNAS